MKLRQPYTDLQKCPSTKCFEDCCQQCVTASKPLAVQLKTTANKVLCVGASFTVIVTICNRTRDSLKNVTFKHFFGPHLAVQCLPSNVHETSKALGAPRTRCKEDCGLSPCEKILYREGCDGTIAPRVPAIEGVCGTVAQLAPGQSKRVQYNLVVTEFFDLPSMTTSLTVCSFERDGETERVKIASNKAFLGETPRTCKPYTLSQPVPCKFLGCCTDLAAKTGCTQVVFPRF